MSAGSCPEAVFYMIKISVIIPCYNVSLFVDRCMESLEKQTIGMSSLEIILVNDASKDATLGKLLLWEMKYPDNICVIPLEKNVMQGAARNIALGYCHGEYIAYLDADDWLVPSALEKVYRAAKKNRAEIVNYLSKKVYGDPATDDPSTKSGKKDRMIVINSNEERLHYFAYGNAPLLRGCWDKLFLREFVMGLDLRFAEGVFDEESLFTTPAYLHMSRVYELNEYLHRYYQNSISSTYNLMVDMKRRDDNAKTWLATYEELKRLGDLDEQHELIEWFFVINYYIRSFIFAESRGIKYDVETVRIMQDTVHQLFPEYRKNKTLMGMKIYKKALELVDIEVNESNIDEYNEKWLEICNENYGGI